MMNISENGLNLIKRFEGLHLTAYYCPANVLTIGYGHTGAGVYEGLTITEAEAERLLKQDLERFEKAVNETSNRLNQNQYDALVSFCFNVGITAFKHSTLVKCVKANPDNLNIYGEITRWTYARGKRLDGLLRRRRAEADLYFKK